MVEQNIQVSQTISEELMLRALILGLEQIAQYGVLYRNGIIAFKTKHFDDRSQVCTVCLCSSSLLNLSSHFRSLTLRTT